jgi:hypothetical protein
MTHGYLTGLDAVLDLLRQFQEAKEISDGGALLADFFGYLFLSKFKFIY